MLSEWTFAAWNYWLLLYHFYKVYAQQISGSNPILIQNKCYMEKFSESIEN